MKWNRIAGIFLFFVASVCLVISIWPFADHTAQIPFSNPGDIAGKLELSNPDQMRVGEKTEISMRIEVNQDPQENQSLTLISKLEFDNMEVTPRGEGEVTIDRSKPLELKWKVTPLKSGVYTGTLWLFIKSIDGHKDLVLARLIEMKANTLFGFSYQMVRIICCLGLVTAVILYFFPFITKKSG